MEMKVSSSHSLRISLTDLRSGKAGLNKKRTNLLTRIPHSGDWLCTKKGEYEIADLAFLTAATGHEFAILSGKREDIIFHGTERSCVFKDTVADLLKSHKFSLLAHSHPFEDYPVPSKDDRNVLKEIEQRESKIISATTGITITFTQNQFDELGGGQDVEF